MLGKTHNQNVKIVHLPALFFTVLTGRKTLRACSKGMCAYLVTGEGRSLECCPDSQTALEQMRKISWLGAPPWSRRQSRGSRRKECVELLDSLEIWS